MIKKIDINYFVNGYSVKTGGSCMDIPVAVVSGTIDKFYYYLYLFLQVCIVNWKKDYINWFNNTKDILFNLNLEIHSIKSEGWDNTLENIKKSIDMGRPVLCPVSYHALFYYLAYNEPSPHMLIINGYDDARKIILVVDCNIVDHGLEFINKEYTLYQLPLSFDVFKLIWEESQIVTSNYSFLDQTFFTITKKQTESFNFVFNNLIEKFIFSIPYYNNLCTKIDWLNKHKCLLDKKSIEAFFVDIHRENIGQFKVFFDTLRIFCKSSLTCENIANFEQIYMLTKKKIISRLQASILHKSNCDLSIIQNQINKLDKELFAFLSSINFTNI